VLVSMLKEVPEQRSHIIPEAILAVNNDFEQMFERL
jgi:hypothetical protein